MSDSRAPEIRDLGQVTFRIEGPLGSSPQRREVLNAQGSELLAQVDQAFDLRRPTRGSAWSSCTARAACSRPATI